MEAGASHEPVSCLLPADIVLSCRRNYPQIMKEEDMAIQVSPDQFAGHEQAVSAIRSEGLYMVEAELHAEDLSATPHVHPYRVEIYILEGVMELHEPDTGLTHRLTAGTRAVVPP